MTGGPLSLHTGSYGSLQQQNGFSNYQSTPVLVRKSSKLLRSSSREKEKLRPLLGRFFGRRKVAMLLLVFLALLVFVFGSFTVNKGAFFLRHTCGQRNGARAPSPVTNPLMGGPVQKAGSFPPLSAHGPFQPTPPALSTSITGWMANPSAGTHPSVFGRD